MIKQFSSPWWRWYGALITIYGLSDSIARPSFAMGMVAMGMGTTHEGSMTISLQDSLSTIAFAALHQYLLTFLDPDGTFVYKSCSA